MMVSPLARKECLFAVGHVLHDTYRIERLIGKGGMASVFEVTQLRLSKRFALKVITAPTAQSSEFMLRFRREAEILAKLDHPNVVSVTDFNMTPAGQPYLVMELLTGEDLAALLQRVGALPPKVALSIFLQAVAALEVAHAHGITHRDLKPANIFLSSNGVVPYFTKVLDFGIAKSSQAQSSLVTDHLVLMGTPAYMAPEQARGNLAGVDARSDQFSLALVLYEMLAGKAAFYRPGEPPMNTICRIIVDDPPPLADPAMNAAIMRALHKEPAERYPSLAAMAAAVMAASAVPPEMIVVPERTERLRTSVPPPPPVDSASSERKPPSKPPAKECAASEEKPATPPSFWKAIPEPPPVPPLVEPELQVQSSSESTNSPAVPEAPPSLLSNKSGQLQTVNPIPTTLRRRWVMGGGAALVLSVLVIASWPSPSKPDKQSGGLVLVDLGAATPSVLVKGATVRVPDSGPREREPVKYLARPGPGEPVGPRVIPRPPVRRARPGVRVKGFSGSSLLVVQVSNCLSKVLSPQGLRDHVGVALSVDVLPSTGPILLGGWMDRQKRRQFEQCIGEAGIPIPRHADIKIIEER